MCANRSVQVNCDGTLSNTISNRISLEFIDKKISKQSNDISLYRNKGEHALFKTNNLPSDSDIYTNSTKSNSRRNISVKGNKGKEPFRYIINNSSCKNKFTYTVDNRLRKVIDHELTSKEIKHDEKATYCRPVINLYNEQFIFKTMERNARLKDLVKKMAMARQQEKEKVTWNNFINMLKNKHTVNDSNYLGEINDYYDETWAFNKRSTLCKELLENIYDDNYLYNKYLNDNKNKETAKKCDIFKYGEDVFCYPTSSQARLIMLGREQRQNQYRGNWGDHASDRNLYNRNQAFKDNKKIQFNLNVRKASSVQTNVKPYKNFTQNIYKDKATNIVEETKTNANNMQIENDKNINKVSLQKVGDKLVTLIESINTFIEEIKISKTSMKENASKSNICSCKEEKRLKIKDAIVSTDIEKAKKKTEAINCEATLGTLPKLDDTVNKESSKAYVIEFEEPTRDCTTGITKSFLNDPFTITDQNIKDINTTKQDNPFYQHITIAVNTDPLSFLALLRLSTDTFKNILSCLPILKNYQYLLSLPVRRCIESGPRYVCNICGAGFNKPSALSDHIFEHNLGITRDSCVCRYVLDNVDRQVSLFRCKYCGKCFTRAYCFELHQNACGKQKGHQDESSDLLLLR